MVISNNPGMAFTEDELRRIVAVLDATASTNVLRLAELAGLPPDRAFRHAILRGCDFRGLNLSGYDFSHADFHDADIRGADFSAATGLDQAALDGAIADASTRWPAGFVRRPTTVLIRAGTFTIGTTRRELRRERVSTEYGSQERPRRKITLAHDFHLAKYPVTVGEFRRFMASGVHVIPKGAIVWAEGKDWVHSEDADWSNPGFPQDDRHPVTCVSFDDAMAYVGWLSGRTRQAWRLPSEAEWEFACRAGTRTARFWGDDRAGAAEYANVAGLALARVMKATPDPERFFPFEERFAFTSPVGSFKPNPWGLYDTLGNVWEWCEDHWHDNYDNIPIDDTPFTTSGGAGRRVLRGASWSNFPGNVRAGNRGRDGTGDRGTDAGFRVARTSQPNDGHSLS